MSRKDVGLFVFLVGCAAAPVAPIPSLVVEPRNPPTCRTVRPHERARLRDSLLREAGGSFHIHALTLDELERTLPFVPPALERHNALVVVTTMRVDRVPYDRIEIESHIQQGPTVHLARSCCSQREWDDLMERERPEPAPPEPEWVRPSHCPGQVTLGGVALDILAGLTVGLFDVRDPGRPSERLRAPRECYPPDPPEPSVPSSEPEEVSSARRTLEELVQAYPCRVTQDAPSCMSMRIQELDPAATSSSLVVSLAHEDRSSSPPCAIRNLTMLRLDPDLPPAAAINQHFGDSVPLSSWR